MQPDPNPCHLETFKGWLCTVGESWSLRNLPGLATVREPAGDFITTEAPTTEGRGHTAQVWASQTLLEHDCQRGVHTLGYFKAPHRHHPASPSPAPTTEQLAEESLIPQGWTGGGSALGS